MEQGISLPMMNVYIVQLMAALFIFICLFILKVRFKLNGKIMPESANKIINISQ